MLDFFGGTTSFTFCFAPHMHTSSAHPWALPAVFVQKQVDWISQQTNPIDLLLNKSCCKCSWRLRMLCACMGQNKSTWWMKNKQPTADSVRIRFSSTKRNGISPKNGREISSSLFALTRFGLGMAMRQFLVMRYHSAS